MYMSIQKIHLLIILALTAREEGNVIAYPFLALEIVLQYMRKNTSSSATSLHFKILARQFSHSKHPK